MTLIWIGSKQSEKVRTSLIVRRQIIRSLIILIDQSASLVEIPPVHPVETLSNGVCFETLKRGHHLQHTCICELSVNSPFFVLSALNCELIGFGASELAAGRVVEEVFIGWGLLLVWFDFIKFEDVLLFHGDVFGLRVSSSKIRGGFVLVFIKWGFIIVCKICVWLKGSLAFVICF